MTRTPQRIGNFLFLAESDREHGCTKLFGRWEFEGRDFRFCVVNPHGSTVPLRWNLYENERTVSAKYDPGIIDIDPHVTACFLAEVARAARRLSQPC